MSKDALFNVQYNFCILFHFILSYYNVVISSLSLLLSQFLFFISYLTRALSVSCTPGHTYTRVTLPTLVLVCIVYLPHLFSCLLFLSHTPTRSFLLLLKKLLVHTVYISVRAQWTIVYETQWGRISVRMRVSI